ncbi:MAG: 3-hydroxyacyl-CoA dehydrogenase NAD-binding domain-containing protein [Flammeovirgaceae bacterium]
METTVSIHNNMVSVAVDADGIAILTIDMKELPTNVMNADSTPAIYGAAMEAVENPEVKGLIITSAKRDFFAGGDLKWMLSLTDPKEVFDGLIEGNEAMRTLETCGKPVVAAINGNALGGGYEIPLGCHYRVAVNDSRIRIGLPETQLGLIPGAGGTQRLPRIIGIQKAMELILQGKTMNPEKALKTGLIDQLVATKEELIPAAKKWILEVGNATQAWDKKGFKVPGGGVMTPQGGQTFAGGIAMTMQKTKGNYPNAQFAMSSIFEGLQLPMEKALVTEARYFTKAVFSKEARNIIRTGFFNVNKANKGAARPKEIEKYELNKVGILGAGMMGAGIAYVTAKSGLEVVLKDISAEGAEKGKDYSRKLVNKAQSKGRMTKEKGDALLDKIHTTADAAAVADCDLVIEAVFEKRELKYQVTKETEAVLPPDKVYASNTSTLPITGLATASERPENFIGLHFFSPVDKMPLVEIIMGEKTSDYALAAAIDYVMKIRKTPIVVNDSRGFFTSRVFGTFTSEGIDMLTEGIPAALIENAAKDAGMPVGPLAVTDEVNIGLALKIGRQTELDTGVKNERPSAKVIEQFVEELDRPGKKEGKGFYEYPEGGKKYLWEGLAELFPVKEDHLDYETVKKRLLHIQALETVRCLEEGVLRAKEDGDVGSLMGFGFPPYTGGAISYIDYVGIKQFVEECEDFANRFGERFQPTEKLKQMAAEGKGFYS